MNSFRRAIVSVIMATFNRGHILQQTIENIFEQDYEPMELIVVNDGSTDETHKILEQLQAAKKIIYIENKQNLGLQKSLNKGIQKAAGKYIARIDDHDRWLKKDKISKQVEFMEKHPETGVIGTAFKLGEKEIINQLTDSSIRKQMLFRSPFCHVSVLMRKSVVEKVGGYDEALPYSEDWDLWLRMGGLVKFANLPDLAVEVIEEKGSLSDNYFIKRLPLNFKLIKKHLKKYPNRKRAIAYHLFNKYFFAFFPVNGKIHKLMKKVFQYAFISKKK